MVRTLPLILLLALAPALAAAGRGMDSDGPAWQAIPGGAFRSSVRFEDATGTVPVAPYALMARPVSNSKVSWGCG